MSRPDSRSFDVHGLGDGAIEIEVVLAIVTDLQVEVDDAGVHRVGFVLEGHLPSTQLNEQGVSIVPLESLRVADLVVRPVVGDRLARWEAAGAQVTGSVRFDRRALDAYRGRGPLRTLVLVDERGDEIVLRRG